jgi:hypothetical protein
MRLTVHPGDLGRHPAPRRSRFLRFRPRRQEGSGHRGPASINQQFEWENKVVGPKEGLDHDKVAATRERGIREEAGAQEARRPEKVKRSSPTRRRRRSRPRTSRSRRADREEAEEGRRSAPRQRDALDNLLDEQGVKPNNPSGGGSSGLASVLAPTTRLPQQEVRPKKTRAAAAIRQFVGRGCRALTPGARTPRARPARSLHARVGLVQREVRVDRG